MGKDGGRRPADLPETAKKKCLKIDGNPIGSMGHYLVVSNIFYFNPYLGE